MTWLSDELLPAPVDAGRIARLVAAAAARPAAPVPLPALSAILCEPFVALHGMLTGPDRRRIRELMVSLYGGQPAVVAALTVPAAEVPAAEVPA